MLKTIVRYFSTTRPEAKYLRKKLIQNYEKDHGFCFCSICVEKMPLELLDVSHLCPRNTISANLIREIDNVEFMCKNCHSLWDRGLISVNNNGIITLKNDIFNYSIFHNLVGKYYSRYSSKNHNYILWHFNNIFLK